MKQRNQTKSFAVKYPALASQWHPELNGDVTPDMVFASDRTKNCGTLPTEVSYASNKSFYWMCPYDDPVTGRHYDFVWEAKINNRTLLGEGCPFIGNDKVWAGYNDLESRFPEIAKQWHPTKNKGLTPKDVVYGTPMSVWWQFQYTDPETGKEFWFEWQAPVNIRTGVGTSDGHQAGCPYLAPNPKVWTGFNDLETRFPAIAAQWHPTKNKGLTPKDVSYGTPTQVWWQYPYTDPETGREFCFEWRALVNARTGVGTKNGHQTGCPYLASSPKVWPGFNDLATCFPEIAAEFHPTKNRKQTPDGIYKSSSRKYWWKCSKCGKVWRASAKERIDQGTMCSQCRKQVNYCT